MYHVYDYYNNLDQFIGHSDRCFRLFFVQGEQPVCSNRTHPAPLTLPLLLPQEYGITFVLVPDCPAALLYVAETHRALIQLTP